MHFTIKDMVYISIFSVLIAICSWISIPAVVPFTLQTMAVFTAVGVSVVLGWCVIPFLIPDSIKIFLAFVLTDRLKKVVQS